MNLTANNVLEAFKAVYEVASERANGLSKYEHRVVLLVSGSKICNESPIIKKCF